MSGITTKVASNGRMVLPVKIRRMLGITGDANIRFEETDDGVKITTPHQARLRARERISKIVPSERSLSEELLEDRRREVEDERRDQS